jgi:putative transposase
MTVCATRTHRSGFSPNEKYAMLLRSCGYVPVPLNGEDYIELLPERWQAINSYGIRIKHRTYDDGELTPLRRQHSGVMEKKGLWEIHHDPYDVFRIWVGDRSSDTDRWITVYGKDLRRVGVPFGELAWDLACEQFPGGTEEQIADAATALLRRAHEGPPPKEGPAAKRSRRVAARARVTASDRPVPDLPAAEDAQEDTKLADVIPLGLFDPLANPWRRP